MAKYTKEQLVQLLRKAGIPEKDIPMMVAIALAESAGIILILRILLIYLSFKLLLIFQV